MLKLIKRLLIIVIIFGVSLTNVPYYFLNFKFLSPKLAEQVKIHEALTAPTSNGTSWFLRDTTAAAAFGTPGPAQEYAGQTDVDATVPTNKTTALAMTDTPGAGQVTVGGTTALAGTTWFRTFLSPGLAAQTIPAGTTFRLEIGALENNATANAFTRVHVYVWREGAGLVATLADGTGANCVTALEYGTTESGRFCITAGTAGSQAIQPGDQIALEVWVQAAVEGYIENIYFNGTAQLAHNTVNSNAMSRFWSSKVLTLQSETQNATTWFLRDTSANTAFGTSGPTQEYASATDASASVPTNKTTALAMTDTPGTGQVAVAGGLGTATVNWFRTFLSPRLASQTIPAGTIFRLEIGAMEASTSANAYTRVHVYVWREGSGFVATLVDRTTANCATEYTTAERGFTCLTTGTAGGTAINAGDQVAIEVWVYAGAGTFTETIYFNGTTFLTHNTANSNALATFSSSNVLTLQSSNTAPALSISQPDGTGDSVTVGDSYNITYSLSDAEETVTAAFYYDDNNSGLDGTPITGACATAAEGAGATCSWNTTGVPPGNYYVYGITSDGIAPQVSAYSPGQITVSAVSNESPSLSISQPDGVGDSIVQNASFNIVYTLGDSDDVVTVAFYFDDNNSGLNGTAISGPCATADEGTGASCSWDTTGVTPGSYYIYGITNDGTNPQVSAYSSGQVTIAGATISVTLNTDGTVTYGVMQAGTSKDTVFLSDTQTARNDGNVVENLNIKGQDTACPWILSGTVGSGQYVHEFSTNGGGNWTPITTNYQALANGIATDGTQNFDLRITVPTDTSCFDQQSADVTIQAVQP